MASMRSLDDIDLGALEGKKLSLKSLFISVNIVMKFNYPEMDLPFPDRCLLRGFWRRCVVLLFRRVEVMALCPCMFSAQETA